MTLLLASVLVLALALPLQAVWTNDPFNGMIYVCCARDQQSWVRSCKLQGDRTLVAWGDLRGTQSMIHYQVLDGAGNPLLAANGVPIVDGTWNAYWHSAENSIMPDGEGGAIAVFRDSRQSNQLIYGQRFDSLGNRLWGPRGLPLVIWPEPDVALLEVTYDALGNYFIILGRITDLYAQKFDRNGQRFWGETGVPVCIASGYQDDPKPVPDGQGGIIVVWNDQRTGAGNGWLTFRTLTLAELPNAV